VNRTPMPARTKPLRARKGLTLSSALKTRTPLKRGKPLAQVSAKRAAAGTPKRKPAKPEGFPEAIRKAALERDHGHCIACGDDRALHVHHRRIKGMGGDSRAHTDCLCNAATLCHLCHLFVHAQRREAEAQGFIVPRRTKLPGSISVMVHGAGGDGSALFPACDGQWSTSPGQVSA
jgi:hypothetical protein